MKQEEVKQIMKECCFGSLSYCCGLEKKCPSRDKVMKQLGLKKNDFRKLKQVFDRCLFEVLKCEK